jgi:hypothetical protein
MKSEQDSFKMIVLLSHITHKKKIAKRYLLIKFVLPKKIPTDEKT